MVKRTKGKPKTKLDSMTIQSIMFDQSRFSRTDATKWLKKHNFIPIKSVDISKNFYRYRLQDPKQFSIFRIMIPAIGIRFVLGKK